MGLLCNVKDGVIISQNVMQYYKRLANFRTHPPLVTKGDICEFYDQQLPQIAFSILMGDTQFILLLMLDHSKLLHNSTLLLKRVLYNLA